jgi:hypothetical protein
MERGRDDGEESERTEEHRRERMHGGGRVAGGGVHRGKREMTGRQGRMNLWA